MKKTTAKEAWRLLAQRLQPADVRSCLQALQRDARDAPVEPMG